MERYSEKMDEVCSRLQQQKKQQQQEEREEQLLQQQKMVNGSTGYNGKTLPPVEASAAATAAAAETDPAAVTCVKASESKQVKRALKSILTAQDEVWGILRENTRLIEQFGQLAVVAAANGGTSNSSLEGQNNGYENGYDKNY